MLANFGLKIRPFKESNLKNFSQIKRLMTGTIYYRPVGKGPATDGLATPHRLRRSVEQKTPSDFSVNPSIPLFENCLKKKLNVPLVKIFLLQILKVNLKLEITRHWKTDAPGGVAHQRAPITLASCN